MDARPDSRPHDSSSGTTDGAIDEAPYAADAKPATVTPICTAARKVLGFRASAATFSPRRPRAARAFS